MAIYSQNGTYALVLRVNQQERIEIGRLGLVSMPAGYYVYVGSAFGPGGLQARIAHHLRLAKKSHWHIDFLRKIGQIDDIWYTYDALKREHQWASTIGNLKGAEVPVPGFGASDCNCQAHLFYFCQAPCVIKFEGLLRQRLDNHGEVMSI
jgi:Uri superfamily endonuclease